MKYFILLIIVSCSCINKGQVLINNDNKEPELTLDSLYNTKELMIFNRYGVGVNSIFFKERKCTFFFTDLCSYEFKCALKGDSLNLIWDYNQDCAIDNNLDSISTENGYPQKGNVIGFFNLKNDSLLIFTAKHKRKLNELNKSFQQCDTLFPQLWNKE